MTVYVVQDQKTIDIHTGEMKHKFDFKPAEEYGPIEFVLKSNASPFDLRPVLLRLHQVLRNFKKGDYLLLTGNPVLLGLAVTIAADYRDGDIDMLQWSGAKKAYIPIRARNVFEDQNGN